jgi:N-acylneuraminate cytidylyltransferase
MTTDTIVIIPARGGSTRIPRKNIRLFNGKPMIAWPLQASLQLPGPRVIVSTDDAEIARIAEDLGAEVPFTRPGDLATHEAGTAPVIRHAIDTLGVEDTTLVVCVYPTAALTPEILLDVLEHSRATPDRFTITVGRHRSPHDRSLEEDGAGRLRLSNPDFLLRRTQDLPTRYFDAGKFYGASAALWRGQETMMSQPFIPYFLPEWAAIDIDEESDWPVAEALHKAFALSEKQ